MLISIHYVNICSASEKYENKSSSILIHSSLHTIRCSCSCSYSSHCPIWHSFVRNVHVEESAGEVCPIVDSNVVDRCPSQISRNTSLRLFF